MPIPYIKVKKETPWLLTWYRTRAKCGKPHFKNYICYVDIKCLISKDEIKELWFRDKAYLMKKPSIDRIDPNGDYIKENCRFIELKENLSRPKSSLLGIRNRIKGVTHYNLKGREFWTANMKINNKSTNLGTFYNKIDAMKRYNQKAKEIYGNDAILNPVTEVN
jgi:hypothetical protein